MDIISQIFWIIVSYSDLHPLHIKVVTAVISAICASSIATLRKKAGYSLHSWALYFQWGFIIYTVSYSLQFIVGCTTHYQWLSGAWPSISSYVIKVIGTSCSAVNSLCFLAAARELFNKKQILPKWALWAALISLVGVFDGYSGWTGFAYRIPDGLFSIYCLFMIGYATGYNISLNPGRRRAFAWGAYLVMVLYAMLETLYALNPLIESGHLSTTTNFLAALFTYQANTNRINLLDAIAITLMLPLKLGLFISGVLVLLRSFIVVSSETVRKMLAKIINGTGEYLIGEEMLKSLSEGVNAAAVDLVIRLPGEGKVAWFTWEQETGNFESRPEIPMPPETSAIGKVLRTGNEESSLDNFRRQLNTLGLEGSKKKKTYIAVPILYRRAVIGCLQLEIYSKTALNAIIIQHTRELASLISFAVQSYRELAAAIRFSDWFASWRVKQDKIDPDAAIQKTAKILYSVLSPLRVTIFLNIGFSSYKKWFDEESQFQSLSSTSQSTVWESPLVVRQKDTDSPLLVLGQLTLIVVASRELLVHPTLGMHHLYRQTISAFLTEALLGIMRDHLNLVLKNFGVSLNNNHTLDFQSWFAEVNKTVREAGIIWAVAANPETNQLFGDEYPVAFIDDYRGRVTQEDKEVTAFPLSPPVADAHGLIVILLPVIGMKIWMGVNREGFGAELDSPTPWRVFLERFAEIADSALVRVTAAAEMQQILVESAQAQGLATMAVTTGTLAHQLTNLVRDIAAPIGTLNEALFDSRLQADDDLKEMIRSMRQSADKLFKLLSETMLQGKIDDRRPCSLLEAAQQSRQLFVTALQLNRISLEFSIGDKLIIDMPFHVVSLAIGNLVSNAIEAMKRGGGTILIEAEYIGELIHCYITDNGPGVHPSMQDRLFKLGATTKRGSGGWGLYLVHRSLVENGGHIELTQSTPGNTRFTIRFPKVR